jgi:hypothetical protein
MNIATHPVAPEQVMAFLDGELSATEAQAVSSHLEHCAECADLAEQLRSTSVSLSGWRIPDVPTTLENSVAELAAKAGSGLKIGRPSLLVRASLLTWKQWAIGSAGAMAALLLLSALSLPNLLRSRQTVAHQGVQGAEQRTEGGGLFDYLRVNGPVSGPVDQQSKVDQLPPRNSLVTTNSPGIAADSNGLFHGIGDHARNSFSVDGQPITDQQSKVFSDNTQGPMIARIVSLSVVVKEFTAARASLDTILARHHGYSAQLSVSTPEDAARSLQISLRIPAPELSATVGDIKALGRLENESQSGEEVTHQHADLVARLKNARETEKRFRAILEQRTGNVAEVLQVEEGIARVRGDIERMEAEQKALEHRVDFAAIELQLTEEYKAQLNPPAPAASTRIHNALVAGYQNAVGSIFGIVLFVAESVPTLLIWMGILGTPVVLVWRRYRRRLSAV